MEITQSIQPNDIVIDLGSGQSPHPRANVLLDKYWKDNIERGKDAVVLDGKKLITADIEDMSMIKDKEYDFSLARQILEHVLHPEKATQEIMRISKAGFISTPTPLWEKLFGRTYHKWLISEESGTLIFQKKPEGYSLSDEELPCDQWYAEWKEFRQFVDAHWGMFYVQMVWKDSFKVNMKRGRVKTKYSLADLPIEFREFVLKYPEKFACLIPKKKLKENEA